MISWLLITGLLSGAGGDLVANKAGKPKHVEWEVTRNGETRLFSSKEDAEKFKRLMVKRQKVAKEDFKVIEVAEVRTDLAPDFTPMHPLIDYQSALSASLLAQEIEDQRQIYEAARQTDLLEAEEMELLQVLMLII